MRTNKLCGYMITQQPTNRINNIIHDNLFTYSLRGFVFQETPLSLCTHATAVPPSGCPRSSPGSPSCTSLLKSLEIIYTSFRSFFNGYLSRIWRTCCCPLPACSYWDKSARTCLRISCSCSPPEAQTAFRWVASWLCTLPFSRNAVLNTEHQINKVKSRKLSLIFNSD